MKRLIELLKTNEKIGKFIRGYERQLRSITVLGIIVAVLFAFFVLNHMDKDADVKNAADVSVSEEVSITGKTAVICVDIGGAVCRPMLAELPEGSRVEDAIEAAGGLTEDADITNINRAEFLNDGDKIFIPEFGFDDTGTPVSATDASGSKININTADSVQLQTLSGIGPVTAQKIIDYRTSNGRFDSIEEIKNVSGIGDKTFDKLKDHITT